jgi:hypothetical protein
MLVGVGALAHITQEFIGHVARERVPMAPTRGTIDTYY